MTILGSPPPAVAVGSDAGLLQEAMAIWRSGGWAMVAIAIVAFVMFGTATHLWLRLRAKGFASVPEKRWRSWVSRPQEGEGPIGGMIRFVTASRSRRAMAHFFEQVNATEVAAFSRDLRILKVCVAAAPLLGLLGTVTGMLATFGALATGGGGEKTMAAIAGGISEALITTETGLVIALPGLFLQYRLTRGCEQYRAFLAHLETVCSQHLHHSARATA
ncbi:MAG: MotA/TolQ/ExbB proton channel family protein [Phycisphaerales bacterium]